LRPQESDVREAPIEEVRIMNKKEARQIARSVTGMLIKQFMDSGGINNEVDNPADARRLYEAFDYLRSVVEHPRDRDDHPDRNTTEKQSRKADKMLRGFTR
jgi:hypothetical protein